MQRSRTIHRILPQTTVSECDNAAAPGGKGLEVPHAGTTRRRFIQWGTSGLFAACAAADVRAGESILTESPAYLAERNAIASIQNERVRVLAFQANQSVALLFYVRRRTGLWRPVMASGAVPYAYLDTSGTVAGWQSEDLTATVRSGTGTVEEARIVFDTVQSPNARTLVLHGSLEGFAMRREITLIDQGRIHLLTRAATYIEEVGIGRLMTHFYLVPDCVNGYGLPLDLAWLPVLHWKEEDIACDYFFRSPAAIALGGGAYAALVPDLSYLKPDRSIPHALDLRVTRTALNAPRLSYGLCTAEVVPHTFGRHRDDVTVQLGDDELAHACYVCLGEAAGAAPVLRGVTSFLWSQYGHPHWIDPRPQVLPFEEYGRRYAYAHELRRWATPVKTAAGDGWGLNNPNRLGANFQAWENGLHVAFGAIYYGAKWQDAELTDIGAGILRLVDSAPRKEGAFPTLFNFQTHRWDGSWLGPEDAQHSYDAASMGETSWCQLNIYEHLDSRPDVLSPVLAYSRFLVSRQRDSGAIPTYFNADLTPAQSLLEAGTSAISGAVLARSARLSHNAQFGEAALRAGKFIERNLIPGLRFQDFESFFSCSPTPMTWRDPWSGIWPQNTLSLGWAADHFLSLYRLTGDSHWLQLGEHVLANLSLYQQVWSPPYLPGYLFGGFGVMNTDGEWSDGRQARFVATYADYFLTTAKREYLERAIASARAGFAQMDIEENHSNGINHRSLPRGAHLQNRDRGEGYAPENAYHLGVGFKTHWTGFDWSAGGALAATAYLEKLFGSVWVDGRARQVVPIDGLTASIERWERDHIALKIANALRNLEKPYTARRSVLVKFGSMDASDLAITINDRTFRHQTTQAISAGLLIEV